MGEAKMKMKEGKREPCKKPPMLKEQLNAFKKAARKINLHTVNEKQAWRLETCYV